MHDSAHETKTMISLSIIFIDQDSSGEICDGCKQEIKDKVYIMCIDLGDPSLVEPLAFYCVICKNNFESGESDPD